MAKTGRIFYRLARGFHTRQAVRQWAMHREPDADRFTIRQCTNEKCRARLD